MYDSSEIEAIHYYTGKPVLVKISGDSIESISEINDYSGPLDLYISPGLFDNQVNGFRGVDFSDLYLTKDMMHFAVETLHAEGITSFFPTVITNSEENLLKVFRNLAHTLEDETVSGSVPGFHLEGPYLSPEEGFYGCHPHTFITKPSWDQFMRFQDAASGKIRQITVSPETEGCIDFIRKCTEEDILVAIGHSNASSDDIRKAVENGARISTHLLNGCANMIHRHRNPIWPQLAEDNLIPTIIADGHHLIPEEIKVIYKIKGPERVILTSDVTHLSGMEPGRYMFFGSEVVMTSDGLIKNPVLDCLAGASLPLRTGIGNVMKFTGCSRGEAINMASANATRLFDLHDRGTLEAGKRADLMLFGMNEKTILIRKVWVKGKRVI